MRVVQGKEPAQFVGIWNGAMVVYEGGVASGFKAFQEEDADAAGDGASKLFQVRSLLAATTLACTVISLYTGFRLYRSISAV